MFDNVASPIVSLIYSLLAPLLASFLLALLISEASDITIYEDKYSYYQSLHSEPATASEIFCAIFLFFSFIIFVGNIIWAIIETVTVKKDSNGITMI